jgi:hypothetical protein
MTFELLSYFIPYDAWQCSIIISVLYVNINLHCNMLTHYDQFSCSIESLLFSHVCFPSLTNWGPLTIIARALVRHQDALLLHTAGTTQVAITGVGRAISSTNWAEQSTALLNTFTLATVGPSIYHATSTKCTKYSHTWIWKDTRAFPLDVKYNNNNVSMHHPIYSEKVLRCHQCI